jgi:hypothetical protein
MNVQGTGARQKLTMRGKIPNILGTFKYVFRLREYENGPEFGDPVYFII